MKKSIIGKILIIFITIIWGVGFVFQAQAAKCHSTFLFITYRMLLASLFLLPSFFIFKSTEEEKKNNMNLIFGGIITGIFLFFAASMQQVAMHSYPEGTQIAGRSAFLTSMYVVFVPLINIFISKKIRVVALICLPIVVAGLYILSYTGDIDKVYLGDFIFILVAIFFALHVLSINYFSQKVNPIKFSAIQFITASIISLIVTAITGGFKDIIELKEYAIPAIYLGIISSGIAYTLQVVAQKMSMNPTIDSLIMSCESIFGAIAGMIFLKEVLEAHEIIGCAVIFIGILCSILPIKKEINFMKLGRKVDEKK